MLVNGRQSWRSVVVVGELIAAAMFTVGSWGGSYETGYGTFGVLERAVLSQSGAGVLLFVTFVSTLGFLSSCCGTAYAVSAPGFAASGFFGPSVLAPNSSAVLHLYIYNLGAEKTSSPVRVVDRLPAGLTAENGAGGCGVSGGMVITCEIGKTIVSAEEPVILKIPVKVGVPPSGSAEDEVEVSGGGAVNVAKSSVPVTFGTSPAELGFSTADVWLTNPEGVADTQAGSHPYALTLALSFNTKVEDDEEISSGGEPRAIDVKLPPGLIGDPNVIPQCSREAFDNGELAIKEGNGCPAASQVGNVELAARDIGQIAFPLYNLIPPPSDAAEFGFSTSGGVNVILDSKVRSGGDDGITEHSQNSPQRAPIFVSATIWGVPAAASHDFQREGAGCIFNGQEEEINGLRRKACVSDAPEKPFLTLPTSCQGQQRFSAEITSSWQNEGLPKPYPQISFPTQDTDGQPVGFTGCGRLVHFNPTIEVAPETSYADTPTGISATLRLPQEVNPEELATAGLKDTTVVLPEGVVINPGQAAGLAACQPNEELISRGTEEGESEAFDAAPVCPDSSKIGEDEIVTPLLRDKLKGSVYLLQSNPPHLEVLVAASGDGVNLKLIGKIEVNPISGRLVTTFPEAPDAPFTEFKLTFSGGDRAALVTPLRCQESPSASDFTTSAEFTPWSTELVSGESSVANATFVSSFALTHGVGGGPCPSDSSPLSFAPSLTAGSTTDQAAGYADFSMLLTRGDGEQRIGSLQFRTPPGLLGMISHVQLCSEAQAIASACPSGSQIGETVVTAGPGVNPLVVPEPGRPRAPIYLTGPYAGAPYGLLIEVPLVVGPFRLETQRVRAKIEVDPHTAQLTITTGALPPVVAGIPTDLRSVYAVVDKPQFIFNPSNCRPMSFSGTAYGVEGSAAALSTPFQVGSCRSLAFKPDLEVSTSGKPSRANGESLDAKLIYPTAMPEDNQASSQANVAMVKVELPKRLPSRLTTLQKACTAAVFAANPARCPAASIVGHAIAITPVLNGPLSGPAYFVSHGGEAFPSLIVVLQGENITVDVEASTFIASKTGITTSTFKSVPDVPVSSFELDLPQGPYSALAANGNLCKGMMKMPTEFVGQNGAVVRQSTDVKVSGCPKAKRSKKGKKATRGKKGRAAVGKKKHGRKNG